MERGGRGLSSVSWVYFSRNLPLWSYMSYQRSLNPRAVFGLLLLNSWPCSPDALTSSPSSEAETCPHGPCCRGCASDECDRPSLGADSDGHAWGVAFSSSRWWKPSVWATLHCHQQEGRPRPHCPRASPKKISVLVTWGGHALGVGAPKVFSPREESRIRKSFWRP